MVATPAVCVCTCVCRERYTEQLPEISMEGATSPNQSTSPPPSGFLGGVLGKKQTQLDRVALCESPSPGVSVRQMF